MKSAKAVLVAISIALFASSAIAEKSMSGGTITAVWMDSQDANNLYILVGTNWYRINRSTVGTVTFDAYSAMAISAVANAKTVGGWVRYECDAPGQDSCTKAAFPGSTYDGELNNFVMFAF